jgi:hypothetical protein
MFTISLAGAASGIALLMTAAAGELDMTEQTGSPNGDRGQATAGCTDGWTGAPLVSIDNEPAPRLVVDAPIPSQLAEGRVVIRYCTHNIRILPVFGEHALQVSPRLGHLHITVNDGPYRWLDTSGQPIVVNKLPPGPHRILIELVDPTHKTLDRQVVSFTVPTAPFAG